MSATHATSLSEVPIWFGAGEEQLFGIHTVAMEPALGVGVIIAAGGGTSLATNVNDISVRLCRRVAGDGFDAFRFDYHGVGESTGSLTQLHLAEPFSLDLESAAACLQSRGVERLILIGSCFGARTVLAAAPNIAGIAEVILIAPPVRDFEMGERVATRMAAQATWSDYLRRALEPETIRNLRKRHVRKVYARIAKEKLSHAFGSNRVPSLERQARYGLSPRFLDPLRSLAQNGIPISIIFGEEDDLLEDFERARSGRLDDVLENAVGGFEKIIVAGEVHGFKSVAIQDHVLDIIVDRVARHSRD